jgi:2-oxoglutarate dehydrogenase E2 component (dihydrolipoamide succinyltransferase)
MPDFELIMPKMGESIMEATILKWLKKEGDKVKMEEAVLEIATDKVDSEVPSPVEGTVTKLLYKEGDVIPVGKPIATITPVGATISENGAPAVEPVKAEPIAQTQPAVAPATTTTPARKEAPSGERFYSPLVINIARQEGIPMAELEVLPGTGKDGRVTKKDILAYLQEREDRPAKPAAAEPKPTAKPQPEIIAPKYQHGDNVEIIEMDRLRKLIADHMVFSKRTSPHVTSFVEADVTNLVAWREKMKEGFQKREGEKLTFTPLFIECILRAIKDFPMINSSVEGYSIIRKKDINIGMATALPSGNLIVPVIRNADYLNLMGLTKKVNDLAMRAREGKLKPEEIEGGTFTITNVGTFGNLLGTPIINQPQVAILATGAIKKKPVVLETPEGDVIAIRQMMFLSHSYDHRVVDGALGGSFVRRVADYLEGWDVNREI